jgi:folate-dependent phosphoribosylglycinamide formyltransferase PurN
MRTLRVVALCETGGEAFRLWRGLRGVDGVNLRVLISNNREMPAGRMALTTLIELGMAGARDSLALLRLLAGRLRISSRPLHSKPVLAWLGRRHPDVGIHATSVIYRRPLLEQFRYGVLNAHIGLLPRYRGRSVMEWSILNGDPTGVTTFFVDEGIDTGSPIVLSRGVPLSGFSDHLTAKRHLFSLDAKMYAEALMVLRRTEPGDLERQPTDGTRWYVMSEMLTEVVDALIAAR